MNLQNRTNGGTHGERGVSEVLGAILVFGLVLVVLALIQVSAVPAANQQIEYEHSQRIDGDFQQLDNAIDEAAVDGFRSSTPLELGTRYPVRLFLLNPGPVSGDIRTNAAEVQLAGFNATNRETDDYLRESLPAFETQDVAYRARYNEYRGAPRIGYEGGIFYERYAANAGGRDVLVDRGALVSGRRITLVTLDTSLSTQQVDELSLDAVPVSSSTQPVSVQAPAGGASITVETSLSEATWKNEVLETEFDPNGNQPDRYVSAIECTVAGYSDESEPCNGTLEITFEQGTYDLRMAKVGLGSGFDEEGPRYLTTVSGDGSTVTDDQTQQLSVEVRDRYNNPVSGVDVSFSGTGGSLSAPTVTSNEDGQASVVFSPSNVNNPTQRTVVATIAGGGEERRVEFGVTVSPGNDGDPNNEPDRLQDINPRTEDVYLQSASYGGTNVMQATFTNTASEDRVLRTGRIPFILGIDNPTSATLTNDTGTTNYGTLTAARPLEPLGNGIISPGDSSRTVIFTFNEDLEQSATGNFDSLFVFTTEISDPADTEREPYTFFVTDGFGNDPFTSVAASDVPRGASATSQIFRFTPKTTMQAEQTVTIDLDPAQGRSSGEPEPVDYESATVSDTNVVLSVDNNGQGAELVYTVGSGGLNAGQQVTIEVQGVRTQLQPTAVSEISFTWSEGGTQPTSFGVD